MDMENTQELNELDAFIKESVTSEEPTQTEKKAPSTKRNRRPKRRMLANKYTIDKSEQSVLMSEIEEETRPYSQLELKKNRMQLWGELNLSKVCVSHTRCGHAYYVKLNGKKYSQVKEEGSTEDVGSCSVCWKLRKTPRYMSNRVRSLVECYSDVLRYQQENDNYLGFKDAQIEKIFYIWLYLEYYADNFRIK